MSADDTQATVERFVESLWRLESEDRELDPLVELFAADSVTSNVSIAKRYEGTEGAREFWGQYRNVFGRMRSQFRNRIVADGVAALEWQTEGELSTGKAITYEGVSILEIADGQVTRFQAYFDPSELGLTT